MSVRAGILEPLERCGERAGAGALAKSLQVRPQLGAAALGLWGRERAPLSAQKRSLSSSTGRLCKTLQPGDSTHVLPELRALLSQGARAGPERGARTPCCRCSALAVGTKTLLPAPAPAPRARAGKEVGTLWRAGTWCGAETWGTWALPLQCPHQHQPLLLPHPHVAVVTRNRRQRGGTVLGGARPLGPQAVVQLLGCSGVRRAGRTGVSESPSGVL